MPPVKPRLRAGNRSCIVLAVAVDSDGGCSRATCLATMKAGFYLEGESYGTIDVVMLVILSVVNE